MESHITHLFSESQRPSRISQVNAALKKAGLDAEIVKGNGYFYFSGPGTEKWYTASVMVNSVSQLTLDQWVAEYHTLKADR